MSRQDFEFYQGFAVGIAGLIRLFDQPMMAIDIMDSNGMTLADLKKAKVAAFDYDVIKKAWRDEKGAANER